MSKAGFVALNQAIVAAVVTAHYAGVTEALFRGVFLWLAGWGLIALFSRLTGIGR